VGLLALPKRCGCLRLPRGHCECEADETRLERLPNPADVSNVRYGCAPCKGGAFQWVQTPPGKTAPAGSNRSSHGGNEVAEAFD
jgi:hypothetical protein